MKTAYLSLAPNLGVKDVDETVKFYTEVLGFNLAMSVPNGNKLQWAMVSNGGAVIMFQEQNNLIEEYPAIKGRSMSSAITFYIRMKNMNILYEKLKGTEYIAKDLHKTFYGADEFAVFDNNGNVLTITENNVEPTTVKNYDNLFLPADDYQQSVRFYSEILGLEKKFEFADAGMVAFKVGNEEPAIILKDRIKFPEARPTIWIEVEDTKAVYEQMKAKGVTFLSEPFKIRTGWSVEFADPSGNHLGFTDYKND